MSKQEAFDKLYELYAESHRETPSSEFVDVVIPKEELLFNPQLILTQLYKNPPTTAQVFDGELPDGGLSEEVCALATICMDREVKQYDPLTVHSLVAVRHELSPEAFDKLEEVIENPGPPPQALIDLMKRKPRWS